MSANKNETEEPKNEAIKVPKRLTKMKANPKDDWTIDDVEQVANSLELQFDKPKTGSHYSVLSPYLMGPLTVPRAKPIKPIYIKKFVQMCEAHIKAASEATTND